AGALSGIWGETRTPLALGDPLISAHPDATGRDGLAYDGNAGVDLDSFYHGLGRNDESDPSHHFDGDAFFEGSQFINSRYSLFLSRFSDAGAFSDDRLSAVFGEALHTAQDFYAHSNWVETFASQRVAVPPLIDSGTSFWAPLFPYTVVQPGIVLVEARGAQPD